MVCCVPRHAQHNRHLSPPFLFVVERASSQFVSPICIDFVSASANRYAVIGFWRSWLLGACLCEDSSVITQKRHSGQLGGLRQAHPPKFHTQPPEPPQIIIEYRVPETTWTRLVIFSLQTNSVSAAPCLERPFIALHAKHCTELISSSSRRSCTPLTCVPPSVMARQAIDQLLVATKFERKQMVASFVFSATYVAFNIVWFLTAPKDERVIYSVMDWGDSIGNSVATSLIIVFVLVPIAGVIHYCVFR